MSDAPMGLEARLMKLADELRALADEVERTAVKQIIEKGDDARIPSTSSAVSRGHVRATVEDLSPAPPTHTGMMCFDVSADEP